MREFKGFFKEEFSKNNLNDREKIGINPFFTYTFFSNRKMLMIYHESVEIKVGDTNTKTQSYFI